MAPPASGQAPLSHSRGRGGGGPCAPPGGAPGVVAGAADGPAGLGVGLSIEQQPTRQGGGERAGCAEEQQRSTSGGPDRQAVEDQQDPADDRQRRERQAGAPQQGSGEVERRLAEKRPPAATDR